MFRNELPRTCFSVTPGDGKLVIIKRDIEGYSPSDLERDDPEENRRIANHYNQGWEINPAQVMAMPVGAMFGFDVPGANPQSYFDNAYHVGCYSLGLSSTLYDGDSLQENIWGRVHEFRIAEGTCFYLDLASIPESMLGLKSDTIILTDMVDGQPLVPVFLKRMENDGCEIILDRNALSRAQKLKDGFQIIAKTEVGPVEYVLGEHVGKFPLFVTWEGTPDDEYATKYYRGHFFKSRDDAIQDFCNRAIEKYEMLSEQRKPSIKEKLSAKLIPGAKPTVKPKTKEER